MRVVWLSCLALPFLVLAMPAPTVIALLPTVRARKPPPPKTSAVRAWTGRTAAKAPRTRGNADSAASWLADEPTQAPSHAKAPAPNPADGRIAAWAAYT